MSEKVAKFGLSTDPNQIVRMDDATYEAAIPEKAREMLAKYRDNDFVQIALVGYCTSRNFVTIEKRDELFHPTVKEKTGFPLTPDELTELLVFVDEHQVSSFDNIKDKLANDGFFFMMLMSTYPSILDRINVYFEAISKEPTTDAQ